MARQSDGEYKSPTLIKGVTFVEQMRKGMYDMNLLVNGNVKEALYLGSVQIHGLTRMFDQETKEILQ